MLEEVLLFCGTVGILAVSRPALRTRGSHGFYRFGAWECLLILLVLNLRRWFVEPFSAHQLISWVLLILSLVILIPGVRLLSARGKPSASRQDASLLGIEKTTALVTEGLYAYIRHPLYSSLLFLGWGIFFKQPAWINGFLVLAASAFLYLTARVEEGENIRYFGEPYREYMKRSKMFVPFLV